MNITAILGAAALVVILLFGGAAYWQYNRANEYQTALSKSEANRIADAKDAKRANDASLKTIADLKESAAELRVRLEFTNNELNDITAANETLKSQNDSWRSRLGAETLKRPKIAARAARIALNRVMRRAECITNFNCRVGPNGEELSDPTTPNKNNKTPRIKPNSSNPSANSRSKPSS